MRKNAEEKIFEKLTSNSGTAPGGLTDAGEIKILICCLLRHIKRDLTREQLDEIIPGSELVNYFNYSAALAQLVEEGLVIKSEGLFGISAEGGRICEVLQDSIPLSVLDKVLGRGFRITRRGDMLAQNDFSVTGGDGAARLRCDIKDGQNILMTVDAFIGSGELAGSLGRSFISDPSLLYSCVFAVLSKDKKHLLELIHNME